MVATNQQRAALGEALYERYGKPLEADHWGEYVAISESGQVLLGPVLVDLLRQASEQFGPGNFIYKVGDKVVGRWR
jgi:hypothetical protein